MAEAIAVIRLPNRFDFSHHKLFFKHTEEALARSEIKAIEIDFSQVQYLDSSALGMLLLLKEKIAAASKTLALVNCRDTVKQVLEIACFGKIFTIR